MVTNRLDCMYSEFNSTEVIPCKKSSVTSNCRNLTLSYKLPSIEVKIHLVVFCLFIYLLYWAVSTAGSVEEKIKL